MLSLPVCFIRCFAIVYIKNICWILLLKTLHNPCDELVIVFLCHTRIIKRIYEHAVRKCAKDEIQHIHSTILTHLTRIFRFPRSSCDWQIWFIIYNHNGQSY